MEIKIKNTTLQLWEEYFITGDPIQDAVLEDFNASWVKKAWTPLVTALELTGQVPENLEEVVRHWARCNLLGTRSKKADALARKKLKAWVEEQIEQARYNVKEARESGLVDRTVEEKVAGNAKEWLDALKAAQDELSPRDLLDPLPVTQEELNGLLERGAEA